MTTFPYTMYFNNFIIQEKNIPSGRKRPFPPAFTPLRPEKRRIFCLRQARRFETLPATPQRVTPQFSMFIHGRLQSFHNFFPLPAYSFLAKIRHGRFHEITTIPYGSIFLCLIIDFPALAGETTSLKLALDGHTYDNAVISYQGGFLAKIKHDEGTKSIPITKLTPEQRTALGITPEMVDRESAREKARQKAAGEKLARKQKQKELFQQELARSEKYSVLVYGHTQDAALACTVEPCSYGYRVIREQSYKIIGQKDPAMLQKDRIVHFKAITAGTDTIDYKSFSVLKLLQLRQQWE